MQIFRWKMDFGGGGCPFKKKKLWGVSGHVYVHAGGHARELEGKTKKRK